MARPGPSLTEQLVDELTAEIDDGRLGTGQRLPTEAELIGRFRVSRTVVREALARLRASGLVESHQGRGSYVLTRPSQSRFEFAAPAPQSGPELVELIEFRIGVETETAALAATRRGDADLVRLRQDHHEVLQTLTTPARSIEADYRFHLSLARAARNRYFTSLMTTLGPQAIVVPRGRRTVRADDDGPVDRHAEVLRLEHGAILLAVERGDPRAAAAAMRVHLDGSADRIRREL